MLGTAKNEILAFGAGVRDAGLHANISFGSVATFPPDDTDQAAIYKHSSGRGVVVVWPIDHPDETRDEIEGLAEANGFHFVRLGRPEPAEAPRTNLPRTAGPGAAGTTAPAGSAVVTPGIGADALSRPVRSQPRALADAVLPVLRELTDEVRLERDRIQDSAQLPDGTIDDPDDRRAVADLDRALDRANDTIRMLEGVR